MVPRQSKRLSGPKPNQGEAEDLCSEDELIPEPPKTTLAPPADRGKVCVSYQCGATNSTDDAAYSLIHLPDELR